MQQDCLKKDCSHCTQDGYCVDNFLSVLRSHAAATKERIVLLKTACDIKAIFMPTTSEAPEGAGLQVSLVTVYRNLALLIEAGDPESQRP